MAIFRRVPSGDQKGKVSYNAGIVDGIINLAVSEIEGVSLTGGKKGIKSYFEKDGIYAEISVQIDAGLVVPEVAFKIQQSVKHNVEAMTKYKIAKVDVHITSVIFPAPKAQPPAEPAPADQAANA